MTVTCARIPRRPVGRAAPKTAKALGPTIPPSLLQRGDSGDRVTAWR
jgi:hypothetical protein